MDEDILRLRVGIFVVIAMCILGILIFLNSEGWVQQYTVIIRPTSAPGVTSGTPIRKNGLLIGRVREVRSIDKDDEHFVLVEMRINRDSNLYANEICSIGSESLLGDAAIEVRAPSGELGKQLEYDGTGTFSTAIEIRRDPFKMLVDLQPQLADTLSVMQDAGKSVDKAAAGVADVATMLQMAFQDEGSDFKGLLIDLRQMSVEAQTAFKDFDRMFNNVNEIMDDPAFKERIKNTLTDFRKVFQEIRVTIAATRKAVDEFGTIPEGVNVNLENLEVMTSSLKAQGPEMIMQIKASLDNVDQLVSQIKQFTTMLNKIDPNNGTIGKLLNDDEIYDAVLKTVRNIEETSTKIEPMVNDLRIFADKIGRKPSDLIRGAIGPGGKQNYKGSAGRDGGFRGGGLFQ